MSRTTFHTNDGSDGSARGLFQTERQREIVTLALQNGRVDVGELASTFQVTTETIRRDLSDLQGRRLVRRVHGGAVPWETTGFEPLLAVRNEQHDAEKRRIARLAVQELPDEGTVMIDSGSTLIRFAECVPQDRPLQVITNSLLTAQALASSDSIDVVVLGGALRKNTLAMVDAQAVATVNELGVDTLFVSGDGASNERGLTTPYREEAALKGAMIAAADRVIALIDSSKFGHDHLVRFATWQQIDVIVTDAGLDDATAAALESQGPTVLQA